MPADEGLFVKPRHGANKSELCWVPYVCDANIYLLWIDELIKNFFF